MEDEHPRCVRRSGELRRRYFADFDSVLVAVFVSVLLVSDDFEDVDSDDADDELSVVEVDAVALEELFERDPRESFL